MADLKLIADSGGGTVSLKAPAATTSNAAITLKLPVADGSANQLLKTDGSGQLGWATDGTTDSTKMPLAGGTFTGDVTFTGANYNVWWDSSDNGLRFNDNAKARFGTGSGDLLITHNGTDSVIEDVGTGSLIINASQLRPRTDKFIVNNAANNENMLEADVNAAVQLYYDNSKKFETTSDGVKFTGVEYLTEGTIYLEKGGAHHHRIIINDQGNDFAIQQSSDSGANTNFTSYLRMKDGGDIWLPVDNKKLGFGAGTDLEIFGSGTMGHIRSNTDDLRIQSARTWFGNVAASEAQADFKANGSCDLYYDNSKKLETTSTGILVSGTVLKQQSSGEVSVQIGSTNAGGAAIYFDGDSNGDFVGGDYSWIRHGTSGNMEICVDNPAENAGFYVKTKDGATNSIYCQGGGKVELMHNGLSKFETQNGGCHVTGSLTADTVAVQDNEKFLAGNNDDLKIYHDGSNSFIENDTGELFISASQVNIKSAAGEYMAYFNDNAEAALYYDDSVKWKTTAEGVESPAGGRIQLRGGTTNGAEDCVLFVDKQNNNDWCIKALPHTGSSTDYGVMVKIHSNSSYAFAVQDEAPSWKFRVGGDGNCFNYNNSYGSISDVKLKENIVDANSQWNDIKALKIRNFNFKRDPSKKLLGVVAQEVETIAPGLVEEAPDVEGTVDLGTTTKHVKYSILYMKAIKALQEAMAKIEVLETKVAALGG